MNTQAPSRRVAFPRVSIPPVRSSRGLAASPPRLWPNLSPDARVQIARSIGVLMRRMQAITDAPAREIDRVDRNERR
jgi:hypothetical protein